MHFCDASAIFFASGSDLDPYFIVMFDERSDGAELEDHVRPEDLPGGFALESGLMAAEAQVQLVDPLPDSIRRGHVAFFVDCNNWEKIPI